MQKSREGDCNKTIPGGRGSNRDRYIFSYRLSIAAREGQGERESPRGGGRAYQFRVSI